MTLRCSCARRVEPNLCWVWNRSPFEASLPPFLRRVIEPRLFCCARLKIKLKRDGLERSSMDARQLSEFRASLTALVPLQSAAPEEVFLRQALSALFADRLFKRHD